MKKNLVLIGMMGSGKSTIGKILSNKAKLNLIDIDKLIEKKTNLKISDVFKNKGKKFFRKIEEKITINSLKSSNNIIATGGGAFLNDRIRKEIENRSHEEPLIKKKPNIPYLIDQHLLEEDSA